MKWVKKFDLFLFDFDGLLVNTEEMHYQAYQTMLENREILLQWDFDRYCQAAHYEASALKEQVYAEFPDLYKREPDWTVLYKEKQAVLIALINEGAAELMPGVKELLEELQKENINRAVVTHSSHAIVDPIRSQHPILNTIPHWITREFYTHPKPNPECYQVAIAKLAKPDDNIIGFEDTPRGMRALLETGVEPCLICTANYPEIPEFKQLGAKHFTSFKEAEEYFNNHFVNKQLDEE